MGQSQRGIVHALVVSRRRTGPAEREREGEGEGEGEEEEEEEEEEGVLCCIVLCCVVILCKLLTRETKKRVKVVLPCKGPRICTLMTVSTPDGE